MISHFVPNYHQIEGSVSGARSLRSERELLSVQTPHLVLSIYLSICAFQFYSAHQFAGWLLKTISKWREMFFRFVEKLNWNEFESRIQFCWRNRNSARMTWIRAKTGYLFPRCSLAAMISTVQSFSQRLQHFATSCSAAWSRKFPPRLIVWYKLQLFFVPIRDTAAWLACWQTWITTAKWANQSEIIETRSCQTMPEDSWVELAKKQTTDCLIALLLLFLLFFFVNSSFAPALNDNNRNETWDRIVTRIA